MVTRRKPSFISTQMKIASGTVATLAVIIGAFITIDDRYAHAGDIKALSTQLEQNRLTAEISVLEIRRNSLQDKVYEGRARKSNQRADIEILDRNQRELNDVEKQIGEKRRAIDSVGKKQ